MLPINNRAAVYPQVLLIESLIGGLPGPAIVLDRDGGVMAFNAAASTIAPTLRRGEPALITLRMPELVDAIRRATASRFGAQRDCVVPSWWQQLHPLLGRHLRRLRFSRRRSAQRGYGAHADGQTSLPAQGVFLGGGHSHVRRCPAEDDGDARQRAGDVFVPR